jgi:rhodanese-related sulfurtransferase
MILLFAQVFILSFQIATPAEPGEYPLNCGLYSLNAIFNYYGKNVAIDSLIKPEYITEFDKSSLRNLSIAAKDFGFEAQAVSCVSSTAVLHCPFPMILHVRKTASDKKPNHFWVILPNPGHLSVVLDAMEGTIIAPEELSRGCWDGAGLVIANQAINLYRMFWSDYLFLGFCALVLFLAAFFLQTRIYITSHLHKNWRTTVIRVLVILLISCILGAVYHGTTVNGSLLNDPESVAAIQDRNLSSILHKVSIKTVARASSGGDCIVDARLPYDFEMGHIPGARNIPPNLSSDATLAKLDGLPKSTRIIIYCMSANCPFATTVAEKLTWAGYDNIVIYREGWNDWVRNSNHD